MDLRIEQLSNMTAEQERRFFDDFEHQLNQDTGEAAKAHLAAGRPIYYGSLVFPGFYNYCIINYLWSYISNLKHQKAS